MRMPPANFSSIGLARLFGADPDDEPKTPPHATPPHAQHSKTAIIAGSVSGVVGLALLVALIWYAATRLRKTRIHPESEQPHYEILGKQVGGDVRREAVEGVELQAYSGSERPIHELGERPIPELGPHPSGSELPGHGSFSNI